MPVLLSITLSDEDDAALTAVSNRLGIPRDDLLARALNNLVAGHKEDLIDSRALKLADKYRNDKTFRQLINSTVTSL